ncbi:hypothetical protein KP509_03G047900 [Ceratopteris richardii]|uniref:Uncharacterized protein n=1 Tax=Ceratopteris richardii TaxID=49495 RepID=A0A8T2V3T0_CERRI|nr:hypothetical protein KP509_03G047900 [Ceratopteris richardii]
MKTESDWWGARFGFVRAGALGAQACMRNSLAEVSKTRSSFREQDQENLYKLVQDKATKGRQGLGIADSPRKIGGAHWKGQKVLLDSDDCSDVEMVPFQQVTRMLQKLQTCPLKYMNMKQ